MDKTDDLAALRAVAEAATEGPWEAGKKADVHASGDHITSTWYQPDATHIATFDPPTVLRLLDRLELAERLSERRAEQAKTLRRDVEYWRNRCDAEWNV
jgi:hypothetical protein